MTRVPLALALVVICSVAAAARPQSPAPTRPGAIDGLLRTAKDRETEGEVQLRNANTAVVIMTARTDRAGAFTFKGVPPGTYFAECVDTKARQVLGTSVPLAVTSGDRVTSRIFLDSALPPTGKLGAFRGFIWTADNLPIPRARVELRDLSTNGIVLIGVTDKFGQFAFGEVPPGKYVAEYVSTGVRQLLAASPPHDIHVDEERSTLISMMPRGNVIGVAVSSNDAPMSNSLIQLRDTASQIVMATTRSGPNGEFRFDAVWPGTYVAELIVVSTGKIAAVTTTLNVVAGESVATLLRGPSGH